MTGLEPERRARLLAVKLAALARDHLGIGAPDRADTFAGGAAMRAGSTGAVLIDEQPARGLGPALAWAERHGATDLHVLVDDAAGVLARRAAQFTVAPRVWWVNGRDLHPVEPQVPEPESVPPVGALDLAPQLVAAGADVVVEHGIVTGEVLGLEMARVVPAGEGWTIEAGVGRHDREAFAMLHGEVPAPEALAAVIAAVRRHRRPGAPEHPLGNLSPERWLRELLLASPDFVGAASLDRHAGPAPRPNIKDAWPAVAVGPGVVVVASVGVDLDLVPFAADARVVSGQPDARLVLVLPERDAIPITRTLAGRLARPAEVVTVPDAWRTLAALAG